MKDDRLNFRSLMEIPGVPYDCQILEDQDSGGMTVLIYKFADLRIEQNSLLFLPGSSTEEDI